MTDLLPCTVDDIVSASDPCSYARINCADQSDYLDFIGFYYCDIKQNVPAIVVISIIFVAMVFNFLGTTADTYLGPALEAINRRLKLSEAVAGVSLLALANGATDVIAGIVAGTKSSGGVTIAIGGLFGACLFTVTVVLARCIDGAGQIKVDDRGLKRDVFFLLLGTVYFIFLALVFDPMPWYMAIGFFVIYVSFLTYVILSERNKQLIQAKNKDRLARVKAQLIKKKQPEAQPALGGKISELWDQILSPYFMKRIIKRRRARGLKRALTKSMSSDKVGEGTTTIKDFAGVNHEGEDDDDEEDNSCFGRVMRVYNAPLLFARNLTMPPFEEETWNIWFAASAPICSQIFLILLYFDSFMSLFKSYPWIAVIMGVVGLAFSGLILVKGRHPDFLAHHSGKLATFAFIVSALWLNLVASCFMDFLSLITLISGLPLNFLSLTMLAWGNSLDDFFVDYVISKAGHGRMAVTGVYGGQLFNLLIGFGGSMVMQSLRNVGGVPIGLKNFTPETTRTNILTILLLVATVIGLSSTLMVAKVKNWVLGKRMMWFLMIFYGTFLLAASFISLMP